MFELPSSAVLNDCWPGASVEPAYAPVLTSLQKSPTTKPWARLPASTSPFGVNALLIVIPGGAVVIQKAFCPTLKAAAAKISIGQREGTVNAAPP